MIRRILQRAIIFLTTLVVFSAAGLTPLATKASAACAALPTDKGQVAQTVNVSATGTYRVWVRIKAPDSTHTSVYLQVNQALCNIDVGDNAAVFSGADSGGWKWVDYQNGTTTSTIDASLTAGSVNVTLAGKADGVEVDRVILTTDTTCTPTGTGDNCANPPDTTPPTVNLTNPVDGSTQNGAVTATATANDNIAVNKVEFYIDGILRSPDSTPPYTYAFNTSSLTPGAHTMYAKAYDTASPANTANSATVNFTVPDVTAPTTAVTVPAPGATLSGTAALSATASDDVKVTNVEFYVDGVLKGADANSPYGISLDTTSLPNGSHSFTTKAYDAAGNVGTSAAVTASINNVTTPPPDTTAPVANITSPANGATVSGSVNVNVVATDNVGVTRVDYLVDGVVKKSDTAAPFTYTMASGNFTNATHTLTVNAYDAAGNVGTSPAVRITVNNVTYIPSDINQDGHVDIYDYSILLAHFGQTAPTAGRSDINGDGVVDANDYALLLSHFGT